jgi:tryptophanyl-tRNA synthetase
MKRLFSGIQPSGELHIGNYLGAIQNWAALQHEYDAILCVVDLHALSGDHDPHTLGDRTLVMARQILACGVDPARALLFVQSHVAEHAELMWVFNTITPLGELERMTQFKDKSQLAKSINTGLLTYPVLQAADILLYKAEVVPVGEDQVQHIELTRDVARKFNFKFGDTFVEPEARMGKVKRLIGLDGNAKMSKSLGNTVGITEPEVAIWEKLKPAMTDPARVRRTDPGNPEVCNIYSLHTHFSAASIQAEVAHGCRTASIGCFDCKKHLLAGMNAMLAPIRERDAELAARPDDVRAVLASGAAKAKAIAVQTMDEVRAKVGLLPT